ncbi:serine/threonine-protein kinase [Nocardia sp. NBC_00511]|uniref:serine/threonine-protein kinase n=1 Tax=Nocardia sp. NBC_00511 TaxID=2903591 RepID=UPI0030DF7BE9
MAELLPGDDVAGYVVERRIGAGGSGTVYAARHPRLPRLAALKIFNRDEVNTDADAWRRFQREADITARFDHPNIVSVYDRGVDAGRLWIAMQFVAGRDADSLTGLAPDRALRIASDIGSALDYAHANDVLHRDVKPSNILVSPAENGRPERALLTDFGIARLRSDTSQVTKTGDISATFAFASPEQVSGRPLDPQTDQYSLACTLFVLLTGHRPFLANDLIGWIYAHSNTPPLHVTQVRPDLPTAFDAVFDRALAKHPDERFATCLDFTDSARTVWNAASAPTSTDHPPDPSRTDPTRIAPTHHLDPNSGRYRTPNSGPAYRSDSGPVYPSNSGPIYRPSVEEMYGPGQVYGPGSPSPEDAVSHRHRAPEPRRRDPARGILTGLVAVLAAALIAGGAVWATISLESHGTPSGAPVSAEVPTAASVGPAQTTPPTQSTPTGQIPTGFLGEWSGTSDANSDDYRLSIHQSNLNDTAVTSTILRSGTPICVFDYRLLAVPTPTDITLGQGTVTTGGTNCTPQPTHELTLTNGHLTRALSVSGTVTYNRIG